MCFVLYFSFWWMVRLFILLLQFVFWICGLGGSMNRVAFLIFAICMRINLWLILMNNEYKTCFMRKSDTWRFTMAREWAWTRNLQREEWMGGWVSVALLVCACLEVGTRIQIKGDQHTSPWLTQSFYQII